MATLQKLRSKSAMLILFVGLALFAFIAEEFVRSLSSGKAESSQRIGKVNGKSISNQEFNSMVRELENVYRLQSGKDNFTEDEHAQIREEAWNEYVESQLIQQEAEELGLMVTDNELQEFLSTNITALLRQSPLAMVGITDMAALQKFLTDYPTMVSQPGMSNEQASYLTMLHDYWLSTERRLRDNMLKEKYESLYASLFISNPVAVQADFDARATDKDAVVVGVPYTALNDDEFEVTDAELQAKYNELKPLFSKDLRYGSAAATRDIKFLDVRIEPSKADIDEQMAYLREAAQQLADSAGTADVQSVLAANQSRLTYQGFPVKKSSLPADVAQRITDETPDGYTLMEPYINQNDTTINVFKLISRTTAIPDSIQYRMVRFASQDAADNRQKADSILALLNGGLPFDSIAKDFGSVADTTWLTSAMYEPRRAQADPQLVKQMTTQATGTTQIIEANGVCIVFRVLDRRFNQNDREKFDVAIVKVPLKFSQETEKATKTKLSQYMAKNLNIEDFEKNAVQNGYMVQTLTVASTDITVGRPAVAQTRDIFHWIFDKDTQLNTLSDIYTCGGKDYDHLVVAAVTSVNDTEYFTLDDEELRTYVKEQVLIDKKATKLQEQMNGAANFAAIAQLQGAIAPDTVRNVNFTVDANVARIATEPAVSAAIARTAKGQTAKGIKGNAGVYALTVINETSNEIAQDDAAKQGVANRLFGMYQQPYQMNPYTGQRSQSQYYQRLYLNLRRNAGAEDNRYIFY